MARLDLETYYKNLFKDVCYNHEQLKAINAAHAISSEYYDVRFGRNSITYRDKTNKLTIPLEHDLTHTIVIYLDNFFEKTNCSIEVGLLKIRISTILNFLKVKHQFE